MLKVASSTNYRPDIDGLRAIAVIAVLIFHFFPKQLQGGFAGVDVFFVISGYLVTSIILSSFSNDTFSFYTFYKKRVKRLFPSLILVLIFCLIIGRFLLLNEEFQLLAKHVFAGATFFSNFLLLSESGYFDTSSDFKPLLHLWSLCIEEQFYLFWPILLWVLRKNFKRLCWGLGLIFLISFYLNLKLISSKPDFTFYMLPTRLWELALGGLLVFFNNLKEKAIHFRWISKCPKDWSWLGLALITLSFILLKKENLYPGKYAIYPAIGTAIIILSNNKSFFYKILSNKTIVYIGLISYPLYLWHWPLISFASVVYTGHVPIFIKIFLLILSFILAYLTYELLEKPLRFKTATTKFSIITCGILVFTGLCGLLLNKSMPIFLNLHQDIEKQRISSLAFKESFNTESSKQCSEKAISTEMCAISFKNKPPTVTLIGDSHANHLYPGLKKVYDAKGENLLLLAKSGTPPLIGIVSKRTPDSSLEDALNFALSNPNIKTIILSAFWGNYFEEKGISVSGYVYKNRIEDISNLSEKNQNKIFTSGLINTVKKIRLAGKNLILLYDIPSLPFHVNQCLPRPFIKNQNDCVFSAKIELEKNSYRKAFKTVLDANLNIKTFDPAPFICNEEKCSAKQDNAFLYSDEHHLSIYGSEKLFEHFSM